MKARRKSDGEIIEVREWRGASDVIYSSPDMNQFYQASDLDFNVDAEKTVISGWVARDKDKRLFISWAKPYKERGGTFVSPDCQYLQVDKSLFPDLTWESDPEPVEIIIKRKNK